MTGIIEVKELQFRSKTSTTFHLCLCGVFLHSKCLSSASDFTSATLLQMFAAPQCVEDLASRDFFCNDFSFLHSFVDSITTERDKKKRFPHKVSLFMNEKELCDNCFYDLSE